MTVKEIENTLYNLQYTINRQRHLTIDDNKIIVRMGRELVAWINGYNNYLIMNYSESTEKKTIFGYPLEIDYENSMRLEVHLVEQVHVSKGD